MTMNRDEMQSKLNQLSTQLTNRIEQVGEVLNDSDLTKEYVAKFQELLTQGTAFGIALVEIESNLNKGEFTTLIEINGAQSLLESIEEWLAVTDKVFA
jgi:hypothetical protein